MESVGCTHRTLNQNSYLNQTQKIKYNSGVLVVFDVDDFKQVNDCHGHVKGDLCLAGIAECIKKHMQTLDIVIV